MSKVYTTNVGRVCRTNNNARRKRTISRFVFILSNGHAVCITGEAAVPNAGEGRKEKKKNSIRRSFFRSEDTHMLFACGIPGPSEP